MKTEELTWSLRRLKLESATKLAENLASAESLRHRRPLRGLSRDEQQLATGNGSYTLGQTLVGSHRSGLKRNREALLRNFRNLTPALIKQGHEGLLENLVTHLSKDLVADELRRIVAQERARATRTEEESLWRLYCRGGTKAVLAATTPAD